MDYNTNCDAFADAVTYAVARHIHPHFIYIRIYLNISLQFIFVNVLLCPQKGNDRNIIINQITTV